MERTEFHHSPAPNIPQESEVNLIQCGCVIKLRFQMLQESHRNDKSMGNYINFNSVKMLAKQLRG